MGKCDICSSELSHTSGYLLSTTQVITNPRYWKFVFEQFPEQVRVIGEHGARLDSYVVGRTTDVTAWHVCEGCIGLFPVDKVEARERRKRWSASGKRLVLGTAPIEQARDAAVEGWRLAFGLIPQTDQNDATLPLAVALYASTASKEKRRAGNSQENIEGKWWQFWIR